MRLELSHVTHLYDVREVLEGLCARLATINGDRGRWEAALAHFKGPMVKFVADGDIDAYIAGYEAFRREMIDGAGNPVLAGMLDSILERTQALIRRIIILPGRAEVGYLQQHTAMLEAMCRGDPDEAERLRRANMRSTKAISSATRSTSSSDAQRHPSRPGGRRPARGLPCAGNGLHRGRAVLRTAAGRLRC